MPSISRRVSCPLADMVAGLSCPPARITVMPLYSAKVIAIIGEAVIAVMAMSDGSDRAICSVVLPESKITIWPLCTWRAASCAR
ncbi:hypothetical protein D3C78_1732260 [compost metagenome]